MSSGTSFRSGPCISTPPPPPPILDGVCASNHEATISTHIPSILTLSTELLFSILGYCSPLDIKQVSKTCHLLREVSVPELYHTVDLSSHNASTVFTLGGGVPSDYVNRKWTPLDHQIFDRQQNFIRTIKEKSALGKHVRRLCWTVLDVSTCTRRWTVDERHEPECEDCPCELDDEPMWYTFQSLINVSHVELCWLRPWREVTPAPSLFSKATSIRLSGCMTRAFVSRIIASPEHVQSLDLCNLLTWADLRHPQSAPSHILDLSKHISFHIRKPTSEQRPPFRLMYGVLDPLVGKCRVLTSLSIATVGNAKENDFGPEDPRYTLLYASWARFLGSVRPVLRKFRYEHSIIYKRTCFLGGGQRTRIPAADELFNEYILSALLETRWLHLKRVEIGGVQLFRFKGQEVWLKPFIDEEESIEVEVGIITQRLMEVMVTGAEVVVDGEVRSEAFLNGEEVPWRAYQKLDKCDFGVLWW